MRWEQHYIYENLLQRKIYIAQSFPFCTIGAMSRTTQHLATLDGLRGVAAFSVVVYHMSQTWHSGDVLPKAYLAVDFFFLLSGFVIAKAYESSLTATAPISFKTFAKTRIIRLYPLIVLAMGLGLIIESSKILLHHHLSYATSYSMLLEAFAFGVLLVPFPFGGSDPIMFPLVPPAWSLFYELLINFFYASTVRRLTNTRLAVIIGLASICLITLSSKHGSIDGGALVSEYFYGLSRVAFSYLLGVILFRFYNDKTFQNFPKFSGIWLAAILVLSFLPGDFSLGWIYDIICIFILYPMIIVVGAYDKIPAPAFPIVLWMGRVSYPVYILHVPIIRNFYHLFTGKQGLNLAVTTVIALLGMAVLSWLALILYDEPVRRFLNALMRRERHPEGSNLPIAGE